MKKLIFLLGAALFLASCALQPGSGSGSISVSIPKTIHPKAIQGDVIARVTLSRNGSPIPLAGSEGVLESVEGGTVLIDKLLPGSGYRLGVSVGTKQDNVLEVGYYGESEDFSITAGSSKELSLTLVPGVFSFLTTSGNPSSMATVGSTLYVQDGNAIGDLNPITDTITSTTIPSINGASILSLTAGLNTGTTIPLTPQLWLNTDRGIYSQDQSQGATWYNIIKIDGVAQPDRVMYSKAIVISANVYWEGSPVVTSLPTLLAMYNSGGLNLGGIIAAEPDAGLVAALTPFPQDLDFDFRLQNKWTSVNYIISGYPDIVKLANSITSDVVSDIAVNTDANNNDVIYAVSSLGTLVVSANMRNALTENENTAGFSPINFYKTYIMNVGTGSNTKSIRAIASTGGKIFAGTDDGIYVADMLPESDPAYGTATSSGFTLISGTGGEKFVSIASIWDGNFAARILTAAVTKTGTVYIIDNTTLVTRIPAAAGVPTSAKPTWNRNSSTVKLYLSGQNGTVLLNTPTFTFLNL